MAESRRWQARSSATREDQFTRPPSFVDRHDSSPLDARASWHGPETRRHLAVAAALIVAAGAAAVAFMMLADTSSPAPGIDNPSAAQPGGIPAPEATPDPPASPSDLGNVTVPPVPPLPTSPSLP